MGGQRGTWVSGLIIRVMALKSRAMYQYGVGGGGCLSIKKRFRQPPLSIVDVGGVSYFFIR